MKQPLSTVTCARPRRRGRWPLRWCTRRSNPSATTWRSPHWQPPRSSRRDSSQSTRPAPSHTGTPWRTQAPAAPTNVTLATTAFASARHATTTRNRDLQDPASNHRSRPGVSQPHRSQRHEVRRRRHIAGNIDEHVGLRRRVHADRTRRRQLGDHLIGNRLVRQRQVVHTRRIRPRPTREHRGEPRRSSTHQRHVGNHRLRIRPARHHDPQSGPPGSRQQPPESAECQPTAPESTTRSPTTPARSRQHRRATLACADVYTQIEPVGDNLAITSLATASFVNAK